MQGTVEVIVIQGYTAHISISLILDSNLRDVWFTILGHICLIVPIVWL